MKRYTLYFASLFIMLSLGLSADNSNLTHLEKHIKNNPSTSSEGTKVITKPIDWKKPNAKLIKL